jgi:quinol monooxygenase YgiN
LEIPRREDKMGTQKVTVVARIKAKPGMEEKVRQELMSLVTPTRSEPGCINYDLHQSPDDTSVFLFYENWVSKEDLDKHLDMPYLKAWREKSEDLLAEPVDMTLWEMISQ